MSTVLKKITIALLFVVFITTSCERSDINNEPPLAARNIGVLATAVQNSDELESLGISPQELASDQAEFVNGSSSVIIPFVGQEHKKAIIATTDGSTLTNIKTLEVYTNYTASQMQAQLEAGTFNATIHYYGGPGVNVDLSIVNSVIQIEDVVDTNTGGCKGATERGGAFDCFGERLEKMNWLERIDCYMNFVPCLAKGVLSCIIDDCTTVGGPSPHPGIPEQ